MLFAVGKKNKPGHLLARRKIRNETFLVVAPRAFKGSI